MWKLLAVGVVGYVGLRLWLGSQNAAAMGAVSSSLAPGATVPPVSVNLGAAPLGVSAPLIFGGAPLVPVMAGAAAPISITSGMSASAASDKAAADAGQAQGKAAAAGSVPTIGASGPGFKLPQIGMEGLLPGEDAMYKNAVATATGDGLTVADLNTGGAGVDGFQFADTGYAPQSLDLSGLATPIVDTGAQSSGPVADPGAGDIQAISLEGGGWEFVS